MKPMTHLERLLGALYASEGWNVLWREHHDVSFKARAMVQFDRAIQFETWNKVAAHGITSGAATLGGNK